jgi:poly(hydroxyalkanoate) depolymerase family esterase
MQGVTDTIRRALGTGDVTGNGGSDPRPSAGDPQAPGTFETHEFSNQAGVRSYKLYVPARVLDVAPPMVVMLHGCTQSASDFAAGTQMNRLAEEHGFLVAYPEQPAQANPSKCWNWFRAQDQARDQGEPSLIAGIAREVASRHGVDPRRIFVAGLSAGAAMAVVLGETYPELFAGVGAHSGLPYGSAHDIPSAMAAMKGGRSGLPELKGLPIPATPRRNPVQAVPIIVFHGDRDHTVQQTNGSQIVRNAMDAFGSAGGAGLIVSNERGVSPGGRSYSREVHADAKGQAHIESWILHGAGHAWSGGHAGGSYTDNTGPDASAAMVRFFLALPRSGSA